MRNFQIGRIVDSPWESFLPPIQGGVFRIHHADADGHNAADGAGGGSQERDSEAKGLQPLRTEGETSEAAVVGRPGQHQANPVSPPSNPLDAGSASEKTDDAQSFLDACTRAEVEQDLLKYPSLGQATQRRIVELYRQLDARLRAEGLYDCNYSAYAAELARYCALAGLCFVLLRLGWYMASAVCLGLFWHQLVFTAHDAGHMGITHDYTTDTVIGIVIADFLGGLSLGWWKHNHNVHHLVTNSPEHDPDIEHLPFFAVSHRFLASLRSSYYERVMAYDGVARRALRWQAHLYYPVLLLGRFNLYRLSWQHLLCAPLPRCRRAVCLRGLELAGQLVFWAWFGYALLYRGVPGARRRLLYVLVSHAATMPLHVQITLSHFGMSTAELGARESFAQRMLRTTMDVACPAWLDWLHGGLQFQAVHHLYPRLPRHNLRRAQPLVQQFCRDSGIPYALLGFVDGNRGVLGRLGDVAQQAAVLARCQQAAADKLVMPMRPTPVMPETTTATTKNSPATAHEKK
jgi:delta8-fatty-acid desaturase